ncbi:hypothetical protein EDB84DRAFT_1274674 [Lactarius hengduanensis]|nr:hypothetical protein EDB84DRAFT_1274674 [Lactarius hengduanensis]
MQVVSHSLTHRGRSASRTRARWQPYASIPPSSMRTPSSAYLHTPASASSSSSSSSVSTPAPAFPHSLCEPDNTKPPPPSRSNSLTLSQPSKDIREVHKHKYVTGLVDAAVRSLWEIWNPNDIPVVFLTQACSATPSTSMHNILPLNGPSKSSIFSGYVQQLPSPVTPPCLPGTASSPHGTASRNLSRAATHTDLFSAEQARINATPLKTFVHEVLRRSRTSCSVLQTALCYIEALRPKVPELVRQEQTGEGIRGEVDQSARVVFSDDPRLQESPKEVSIDEIIDPVHLVGSENHLNDDAPRTVRMMDDNSLTVSSSQSGSDAEKKVRPHPEDLPSLPPLPSPLLCPRRAFLASLILASKFMQDKCYSNRAWAKLAGLPAREIGRCERALGEALGWRLWVGKIPSQRFLPRSQSAGDLCGSRASADAFSTVIGVVRRNHSLPGDASSLKTVTSSPFGFTTTIPTSMQGSRMLTPETSASEYSPTPTLNVSPASTDASSDSLAEERTVQMTFVDHVSDPDGLKTATPAVVPALAYAYASEGGILRAWNGFAWNGGPGSGWIRGDAESLSLQY